jgi:hypothetical protein
VGRSSHSVPRERSLLDPSGGISSPLLRVKRGCLLTLMIVSNGCHAYRIKPERDKFRATPKSRVGRPTVWSAESALLLKARFWEQNANRGHHGRENPGKRFRCVCRCSRTAARVTKFYLRHRDQLEEWFALRAEATAATTASMPFINRSTPSTASCEQAWSMSLSLSTRRFDPRCRLPS